MWSIHGGWHEISDGFRVNVEDVPLTHAHVPGVTSPLNQEGDPELYLASQFLSQTSPV